MLDDSIRAEMNRRKKPLLTINDQRRDTTQPIINLSAGTITMAVLPDSDSQLRTRLRDQITQEHLDNRPSLVQERLEVLRSQVEAAIDRDFEAHLDSLVEDRFQSIRTREGRTA